MALIYGELTADHQQIVLVAGGTVAEDVAPAARRLQLLTPLIAKSRPPGAVVLPATWPAVVQLAHTFGRAWLPGPRLAGWITEQLRARTGAHSAALTHTPPPGLTPYQWQVEGARMIAATGHALITDEPGCLSGDTPMAVHRAGKGFTTTLRELVVKFNGGRGHRCSTWRTDIPTYVQRDVAGVVRLVRVQNAWASGVKTTYTVTTESGRTIRATDEHPFLTTEGWKRLDQLGPSDLVRVLGSQAAGRPRAPKARYREVAGLRAHPHARGLGRRTSTHRVAEHRLLVEAVLNGLEYDEYVARVRRGDVTGLTFLDPRTHAVHHKDHNPLNNVPANLTVLTHSEHHALHATEGAADRVLFKTTVERVVSVEHFGEEATYDLEVGDDPHNFLANGFVVHNTGKTVTAILGLRERLRNAHLAPVWPAVVVCPASVVDHWVQAWLTWSPQTAVAWRGAGRASLAGTADVYVTSYDTARADATAGGSMALVGIAASVVIDECHLIKNPHAKRSLAVRRIAKRAKQVIALSGTPITHHPGDLWPTLVALEPDAWPSRERWVNRYCETVPGDYGEQILGLDAHTEPEFRMTLLGRHRRVAKADVLADLPPKVYSLRTVELPAAHRRAYDEFEAKMLAELPDDGGELSVMSVLAQLTHLSALASAAADVEITTEPDADGVAREHVHLKLKAPSWKVDALLEVLDERPGSPVVAFAPSKQLITLAGTAAEAAGLRVGYIVGGQTAHIRTLTVEAFQAGEFDLICATTGAGGVGLTLTAARTCVFLQRPWSLVESIQAEDRCHRIGSERHDSIEIVDVVARNTIDARVRGVLRDKAGQLADLVQDPRIVAELLGGASVTKLRKAS